MRTINGNFYELPYRNLFFIDIRNLTVNYRNLTFYVHSLLLYSSSKTTRVGVGDAPNTLHFSYLYNNSYSLLRTTTNKRETCGER